MASAALADQEGERPFDRLSKRHFDRLASYIYDYSGIRMPPSKLTMLEGRLRRRLRATGHHSLDAYCDFLFKEDGIQSESVQLIDAVTTNKTDFFREPAHFDFMRSTVLPEFQAAGKRRLRVWSSASSTGAEAYTLAMVLNEFCGSAQMDYFILATDLSTEVLATGVRGIYPASMVEPVPPDLQRKYVMRGRSAASGEVRVHPALRSRVGFARMNLMGDDYPVGDPMDIIFCRNVLIYFDKRTQAKVLHKLCGKLARGGYLFVGHSESATGHNLPLTQVIGTVFKKA